MKWWLLGPLMALLPMLVVSIAGCAVARPFATTGADRLEQEQRVLVVVTHAVIHPERRGAFDEYVDRLVDVMDASKVDGLIGFSIRKQLLGNEVWTLTVWRDEVALAAFMRSGLHREAVQRAGDAVASLRSHHFQIDGASSPPSWTSALSALEAKYQQSARTAAETDRRP